MSILMMLFLAHRAHASTYAVAQQLPSFSGPVMAAELDALSAALDKPQRPVAAVVGGAKVSTKLAVLENLLKRSISCFWVVAWQIHFWLLKARIWAPL